VILSITLRPPPRIGEHTSIVESLFKMLKPS